MTAGLDLGALVGRVVLDTTSFDRAYTRTVQRLSQFGVQADKAAMGVDKLDASLADTAAAANRSTTALSRNTKVTTENSVAANKMAATEERNAAALTRVAGVMAEVAGESARVQQATLRLVAAQDRYDAMLAAGTASTRTLASAQATLIGAQRSLTAAQEAGVVAAGRFRTGLASTAKMAGELGLLLGGIEIARKAFEFISAGKQLTDSLNLIQAASRTTDAQMQVVRDQALALGKDLTVPAATAVDAANAILDLVKAGIALPRALQAARPALLLAAATQSDMADTAKVLGDTMDIFAIKGQNAAHAANIIGAATLGASHDLLGFFDEIKQAGPTAQALGLSLDSVSAALVLLAKHGISQSMGGAGLKTMLTNLTKDVPKAQRALDDLGVTAFDTQGKFVGFTSLFDQLHSAQKRFGNDSKRFVGDLNAAFGVRSQSVAALFAKEGGAAYDEVLNRLKSGDLQKYANIMNRGVGAGFRQLNKEATAAGISVYQNFEPALVTAVDWIGTNLPKAVGEAKNILTPFGNFVGGALSSAWHLFAGAVSAAATVLGPVVHLIEALKTPLGGIGALILGMWAAFKGAELVGGLIAGVATKVTGMATTVGTATVSYARNMGIIGAASEEAAAVSTTAMNAIADEAALMSSTVTAAAEEEGIALSSMLGPLAAIGAGIALVVTLFGKSDAAAKEAADATKAYTDAFKNGGLGTSTLTGAIVKQLQDNKLPDTLKALSDQFASSAFTGGEFVNAIEKGGKPLDDLRTKLQAVVDAGTIKGPARGNANYLYDRNGVNAAKKALADLNAQYTGLTKAQAEELNTLKTFGEAATPIQDVAKVTHLATQAAVTYAQMLGFVTTADGNVIGAHAQVIAAVKKVSDAYAQATGTGNEFLGVLQTFSTTGATAADRATLIGATLKAANGDALNFASSMNASAAAIHQLGTDIRSASGADKAAAAAKKAGTSESAAALAANKKLLDSVINLKTGTIRYNKAAAAPLISGLQSIQSAAMTAAEATFQHARATMSGKKAADLAYREYKSQTQPQLIDELKLLGLHRDEAKRVALQYLGMPKKVKTLLEQEGADPILTVLNKLGQQLSYLTHVPWVTKLDANPSSAHGKIARLQSDINSIKQGRWPDLKVGSDAALQTIAALQARIDNMRGKTLFINTIFNPGSGPNNAKASARGTQAAYGRSTIPPNTAFTVGERGWEGGMTDSQGRASIFPAKAALAMGFKAPTGYASGTMSKAQTAAEQKAYTKASDALTGISISKSGFSWVRFLSQIDKAAAAVSAAVRAGATAAQVASLRDRLHRDERRGDAIERALGRSIHGAANKLGGSLANLKNVSSVSDIRGQIHTLEGLLRQAGLPKAFINGLDQENRHILALVKVRDQAARGLAKANSAMAAARAHEMNDYRSFSAASRGAFDITNPVASGKRITAGSLRAGEGQALTRVRMWVSGITKLAGKHIFPGSYLRQLAGGGPTPENIATVQALLSMSGSGLRSFAADERQIAQLSNQGARVVAGRLDSHQLRVADRRVQHAQERETRAQEHVVHALDHFGHEIVNELRHLNLEHKIKGGDLVMVLRHGAKDVQAHHRTGKNPIWGMHP